MSSGLRTTFLGNDPWSVPSLRALSLSSHTLGLVLTRVPRPAGRGSKLTATAVAEAARSMRLPLIEAETVRHGPGLQALVDSRPEVLVVVAYGEILREDVLSLPDKGVVNVHFSLLPRFRGASPVQHALLEGLDVTGVSTMLMDAGLDTGPVLLERREPIRAEDDAGSLGARLADIGAGLLVETLDGLASGTVQPVPQDEGAATQASKLGSKDRWLEWSASAEELVRRVRALAPDPGATTTFRGKGLKVFRAVREPVEGGPAGGEPAKAEVREAEPGTVISVERDGFLVGTGAGAFRPLEVGPAGRRRMTAAELVHGFHIRPGERMG